MSSTKKERGTVIWLILFTFLGTLGTCILVYFGYKQITNKIWVDKTEYEESKKLESNKEKDMELENELIERWKDYLNKYLNKNTNILIISKTLEGKSTKEIQKILNKLKLLPKDIPIYSPDINDYIPEHILVKYFSLDNKDFAEALSFYLCCINETFVEIEFQKDEKRVPDLFEIWMNIK